MRLPRATFLAAFCAAAVLPATAAAQDSDPEAGSPPGAVYELPVESGREDAAPLGGDRRGGSRGSNRRGGSSVGQGGSGAAGGAGGSRGTGGTPQIGGSAARLDARGSGSAGGGAGSAGGETEPSAPGGDSPLRSENNFGSSSSVPGLDEQAPPDTAGNEPTAATAGLGPGGAVGLVALAIIAALGLGLGLRRLSART